MQMKPVLRLARLLIHPREETTNSLDDLWQPDFVGGSFRRVLENGFQQERVSRKPSSRFREIPIELKFARLW